MVNFGWNSASILGLFLAVSGAGLYFLRSVRPELSRDYDIFFSAVGLACGVILLFNGWRLDPILQFSQFLLAASTAFFAFETVRLRGLATEQAKRGTPIVDDDRPVSRSYKAYREPGYEELEPEWEARVNRRQLRGSPEGRSEYEEESRRSRSRGIDDREPPRSSRSSRSSRPSPPPPPSSPSSSRERYRDRPSSRPAKNEVYPDTDRYSDNYDEWEDDWEEPGRDREPPANYDDRPSRERPSRRPPVSDRNPETPKRSRPSPSRPSSPTPTRGSSSRPLYEDEEPAPYVDYVDYSEARDDRNEDFDDFEGSDEERADFDDFEGSDASDRYEDRNDSDNDEDWEEDRKKGDRFDY
ncbi:MULTISPECIES: Ycf66 family protein [Spirulina sp. CCY15215]|uniref:Ycf66 family protein n=1 Tax=Spirulina sp. CCY15215 TaxID=2767591 RepID=UPI00194E1A01|nr:Ycf66 family protein [Spirulina major]